MKKAALLVLLVVFTFLAVFPACGLADVLGFGYVNGSDVALRKSIGGNRITRVPKDTCVWINDSKPDSNGDLWYQVNAVVYHSADCVNYSGWMKAEFIDAGDTLWHDVKSVSAASFGMIALRKDGTVESAGGFTGEGLRSWDDRLRNIRQVGVCSLGWVYYAVSDSGVYYDTNGDTRGDNSIRLIGGEQWITALTVKNRLDGVYAGSWIFPQDVSKDQLSHVVDIKGCVDRVLFMTDEGAVFVAGSYDYTDDPDPCWETWTDLVSIEAAYCGSGTNVLRGRTVRAYVPVYAGVRRDGTVIACPASLAALTADWKEIRKIVVGADWALGLKQDGTVLSAGIDGRTPPDVSGWTGIVDLDTGDDYCVGVTESGALVFAGNHIFQ